MTVLYLDCFAGISGNMFLGAMLDAGLPLPVLQQELAKLPLLEYQLRVKKVTKAGITGTYVEVSTDERHPHRHLRDILQVIDNSALSPEVKKKSTAIFRRLAEAEAKVHRCDPDAIHFHEVGAVDAIIDIVGAAIALEKLQITRVFASPLNVGSGTVHTSHGVLPVPAPATLELLAGVPVYAAHAARELTTPTGAAILTSLSPTYGPMPPLTVERIGYGAGTWDLPIPNLLRALLGQIPEQWASPSEYEMDRAVVVEANIDNMNPEWFGYTMDRLFAAGALDVTYAPSLMKKNRPAVTVTVIASPDTASALIAILFAETTTLGVRTYEVTRYKLPRFPAKVETPYGEIPVKISTFGPGGINVAPEYEACKEIALQTGQPLKDIYEAAKKAYHHKKA